MLKMRVCFFLAALCAWGCTLAQLPEVTEAAVEDLGTTYGFPQTGGFVFIDGRYIPPPYTVTRRGNGLFINRILVERPVAWPRGGGAASGAGAEVKRSVDEDGDFEVVAQDQDQPTEKPVKTLKSIDDLFADEDEPAEPATPLEEEPERQTAHPVEAMKAPGEAAREKAQMIESLDRVRRNYEQALARGEIYFFGKRHHRVNGTRGTARTLMGVLPRALRNASSPQDLLQRLEQGGVYFVDIAICTELFRNKTTFPQLEERLKKIEESEALEAMKKAPARTW